jgi:hypothetical protein
VIAEKDVTRLFLLLLGLAVLACDGCEDRPEEVVLISPPPTSSRSADGGFEFLSGIPMMGESLILEEPMIPLAGKEDFENRYPFTVTVTAHLGEHGTMMCSGGVISRHLVLTAGHCVCPPRSVNPPRGERQTVIDTVACAASATVETLLYKPMPRGAQLPEGAWKEAQPGTVRPHPDLRILLDSQNRVVSTHADLAIIVLSKPLGPEFGALPLAHEEVETGESVVITGYGYDETSNSFGSDRRSCANKVTQRLEPTGERVLVEQPGRHLYRLDSGGPCLRVGLRAMTLVGVSSRSLGQGASFTSIHGYRDWLRAEIQRAELPPRGTPPVSP